LTPKTAKTLKKMKPKKSDYVRVDLRVEHPTITAIEIAQGLGVSPARVGTKGEPRGLAPGRRVPPGSRRALWPFHYASFSFGEGEGGEQLEAAFHLIETKATEIARLTNSGGRATLDIFVAPSFGWAGEISAKELEQLVRAGVALGLDVYREPERHFRTDDGESE
jgi:hypothetical protein